MHVALVEFRTSTPYPVLLANALADHCQVTLMLPDRGTNLLEFVDDDKVDLRPFSMPRIRQPANLSLVWQMSRQLRALDVDLVHITYWHPWGTLGLGIFSPFPMVATVHDLQRHEGERGLIAIPSFTYRWQWKWATQVIVHASAARTELIAEHGCQPDRVHTIPIGSYEYYRMFADGEIREEPATLLFFGRIWGYKGLQVLIEAEPIISEQIPDLRVIIAGEGEPFDKYERLMVNPQRFEVHNYRIPNENVAGFFQRACVVVLPYLEASQSGVVSIAYAFGKPVVATRVGGLPDVVLEGQTGFLVPPKDSRGLAEAVITILRDAKLRRQMGQRARDLADSELSWKHIALKTYEVYKKS